MVKGNLAKNTTYFTAALTFQKILSFIFFWYVSNHILPSQLGQYVFALSFTTLFSILIDLGLSPVLTREASKDRDSANRLLRGVIGIKIPLGLITLILCWLVILVTGKAAEVRLLVYLASFIMILDSFSLSFWVIFRARQTLKYESIATILVQMIIFVLGIIAVRLSGEVKYLMMSLLAASIFNFILSSTLLKIKLGFSLKPSWDKELAKYFFKIIPAFAIAGIFVKIYNTVDSVLLGYLASDTAVGFYAVPAKVVYALQQVVPAAFAAVIFPAFSYYYTTSKELLEQTFKKAFNYLTITSLPMAAGLTVMAEPIIAKVWPNYLAVVPTFIIMALTIPFIFLAFPTGYLLNACDRQKNTTINRGIITTIAVILNITLIPIYSYLGSAIAFLITNVILLFLDLFWVNKVIPLKVKDLMIILGKSFFATLIMVITILAIENYLPLILTIFLGAVCYFVILWLVKGLDMADLKLLKR